MSLSFHIRARPTYPPRTFTAVSPEAKSCGGWQAPYVAAIPGDIGDILTRLVVHADINAQHSIATSNAMGLPAQNIKMLRIRTVLSGPPESSTVTLMCFFKSNGKLEAHRQKHNDLRYGLDMSANTACQCSSVSLVWRGKGCSHR